MLASSDLLSGKSERKKIKSDAIQNFRYTKTKKISFQNIAERERGGGEITYLRAESIFGVRLKRESMREIIRKLRGLAWILGFYMAGVGTEPHAKFR